RSPTARPEHRPMSASPARHAADRRNTREGLWPENSPNKPNFGPEAGPRRAENRSQVIKDKIIEESAVGPAAVGEFAKVGDKFAEVGRELAPSGGAESRRPLREVMFGWPGPG